MRRDSTSFIRKVIASKRERAQRMAHRRWELDRERRAALAEAEPLTAERTILRRIVVIDRETRVREAVIYADDTARAARRKLRHILTPPTP